MRSAVRWSAGFLTTFRPKCLCPGKRSFGLNGWTLALAFVVLMTLGCGTPHATLYISAPSAATVGVPFTITVTAMYEGKPDTAINSYMYFTSSDKAAILPSDFKWSAADAGSYTWPNGVTFKTPGNQTITATITMATGINGTVTVTVSK